MCPFSHVSMTFAAKALTTIQGSLDPTRGKSTKEVKFTKTFRRLPSPIEEDASDSEMDIGRLESQSVTLAFDTFKLLISSQAILGDYQNNGEANSL